MKQEDDVAELPIIHCHFESIRKLPCTWYFIPLVRTIIILASAAFHHCLSQHMRCRASGKNPSEIPLAALFQRLRCILSVIPRVALMLVNISLNCTEWYSISFTTMSVPLRGLRGTSLPVSLSTTLAPYRPVRKDKQRWIWRWPYVRKYS